MYIYYIDLQQTFLLYIRFTLNIYIVSFILSSTSLLISGQQNLFVFTYLFVVDIYTMRRGNIITIREI